MDKKFKIKGTCKNETPVELQFDTYEEALKEANGWTFYGDVQIYECTDFIPRRRTQIEEIASYEDAIKYLDRKERLPIWSTNDRYINLLTAFYKLRIIAEAWNKIDGFIPNANNHKYYPTFHFDEDAQRFYWSGIEFAGNGYGSLNLNICFKSAFRAKQFGVQFIDLWNEVLKLK